MFEQPLQFGLLLHRNVVDRGPAFRNPGRVAGTTLHFRDSMIC
jgi:hypothetical protein